MSADITQVRSIFTVWVALIVLEGANELECGAPEN